jgi:pimeloyl-ACP methyl ester carboxylesterase
MNFLKRIVLFSTCLLGCSLSAQVPPVESFLDAPGPTGPLKGTLLTPALKSAPVVLIIPGSGPTDRDGNNPAGIKASTYRLLAEGLASRGVATLRIDKRGMFASAAATPDANAVTIADYVVDVRSWVAVLRKQTGAPCVWLLGHSEGGLVAMAAAKEQADVCGLVLVATAGRPMGEVLRDQLKANPANGPILGQALPAIDMLEQGHRVDTGSMHPALQGLFNPAVQGFLISAFSYDPRRVLSDYSKPVLVLQGQRDIQVGVADARLLKQAVPQASLVLLPNVNHVLKSVTSDDVGANIATYADPGLPLASGVVEAIANFLTGKLDSAKK